jgi:hypothetical protein
VSDTLNSQSNASCSFGSKVFFHRFLTYKYVDLGKSWTSMNRSLPPHSTFFIQLFLPPGSLWRRQSQQSFNTLTPFYFLSHSLHVSAPTAHPKASYTIRYFNGLFLIQRIRCTYAIWCRDVTCCTSVLRLCRPFYFLSYSLPVSAPTAHPKVRYTIRYLKDYF